MESLDEWHPRGLNCLMNPANIDINVTSLELPCCCNVLKFVARREDTAILKWRSETGSSFVTHQR